MRKFNDPRDWFFEKRFGLFIHWGIYSQGGLHEQELWRYGTPWEKYAAYADQFCPGHFDPGEWLDIAEKTGMRYLAFTAKHHDGFCMWDTKETDFNVMHTPYGRDVLRAVADECHRRDFPLVIYYSVVDWHHPNYPNIGRHHELNDKDISRHDMGRYMVFLKNQIRELCTNYGKVDGIWWDMNVAKYEDRSVNEMIRRLQPSAVVNNRGFDEGDFSTPERSFNAEPAAPFTSPVEACNSVGTNSWGYRAREDYASVFSLQRQMALNMALGANYLLNVGPMPDGRFPAEALRILDAVGAWYSKVGAALTSEPCFGAVKSDSILCTCSGNVLNVIALKPLSSSSLELPSFDVMPEKALLLNTGLEVEATFEKNAYRLNEPGKSLRLRGIPADSLAGQIPVFRLEFSRPVSAEAAADRFEGQSVGGAVECG